MLREVTGKHLYIFKKLKHLNLGVEEYRSYYLSNNQWVFPETDLKYFNLQK